MNKDDILTKSRLENKNRDIYERELLKQASEKATIVQMVLATIFFVIQILVDKGTNWGLWAIVFERKYDDLLGEVSGTAPKI